MTEYAYFVDGVDFTETTYPQTQKTIMERDGYLVGTGSELEVIENTPAAMNVVVGTGEAWIQGIRYVNSAAKTVTVTAANPTNPRIDRIVVRLTWATNTCEAVLLAGTAAATPAAPALTQSADVWEISLAQVLVGAGATSIVSANITDERASDYCGVAACRMGTVYVRTDGSLDASDNQVHNVVDPTSDQDAATKKYVDDAILTGAFLGITVKTSGTTFTTTANTHKVRVTLIGAGGGGGGIDGGGSTSGSAGAGGAGAKAVKVFDVDPSTEYTYAIGALGSKGTAGVNNGTDGGDTTFTVGAVTVTAAGGKGGTAANSAASNTISASGLGGTSSNGDLNGVGEPGTCGSVSSGDTVVVSSKGGSTEYGGGGRQKTVTSSSTQAGNDATGYGAGGAGAASYVSANDAAGGDGTPGVIIIEEYA